MWFCNILLIWLSTLMGIGSDKLNILLHLHPELSQHDCQEN